MGNNSIQKYLVTQKENKNLNSENPHMKNKTDHQENGNNWKIEKPKKFAYVLVEGKTGEKKYCKQRIKTDFLNIENAHDIKDCWVNVWTPSSKIDFYTTTEPAMQHYTCMTTEAKAKKNT